MNFILNITLMIKKIHYVWLGGNIKPQCIEYCINSWRKKCPDYEIIEWNESNFDIDVFPWVKEAIKCKKYAFAADFIRLYVLEKYGGIYLDTDVEICERPDTLLDAGFVSGIENFHYRSSILKNMNENGYDIKTGEKIGGFGINVGFIYSVPHHPVIQYIISNIYQKGNRHFINEDMSFNAIILDGIFMDALHCKYELKYIDRTQKIDDIIIYSSEIISTTKSITSQSVIIHWYDQTWNGTNKSSKERIKRYIRKHFIYRYFVKIIRRCR